MISRTYSAPRAAASLIAALLFTAILASAAQAAAPVVTTGDATADGPSASFVRAHVNSQTCPTTTSYLYGTTRDLGQRIDSGADTNSAGPKDDRTGIGELRPGTLYYYRAIATTRDCAAPGEVGEGRIRCFQQAAELGAKENVTCAGDAPDPAPTDNGGGSSTGGNGDSSSPFRHVKAPGRNCVLTNAIRYVFNLSVQRMKCSAALALLKTHKAKVDFGGRRKFKLGGYRCVALSHIDAADYKCEKGPKAFYTHTYASGSWKVPGQQVLLDF
jgi:hypothetical protein